MTEKEIKGVANKIADALIEPLFKTHPDHQSCWQIADAVLKGMYGFISPNSSFTFYSDKVAYKLYMNYPKTDNFQCFTLIP